MKICVLLFIAAVWVQLPTEGSAVCCPTHRLKSNSLCDDCNKGTPYCGKGRCNMLGCDCAGGCRNGYCGGNEDDRRRRSAGDAHDVISPAHMRGGDAHDVIRAADANGDGRMSLEEAHAHMANTGIPANRFKRSLVELDLNKDAFLSAEEIDS